MNSQTIFKAFNEITRKFEQVDELSELLPGQKIIKMFWCNSDQRFVTVPGASLFKVNNNFELVAINE